MKRTLFLLVFIFIISHLQAQEAKLIDLKNGESLSELLGTEINSIKYLTIKGKISDADFSTLKNMKSLISLDLLNSQLLNNKIPENAFSNMKLLDKVILPSSLKTIGIYAFYKTIITDIDFSKCSQLESIEKYAFASANGMKTIDLSTNKNLKNIGEAAFGDSKDYGWKATSAKVILPDNLEKIDTFAFSGFGGTVVLPSSLKTIGSYAFYKTTIADIDLSKCSQLETIEKYAFASANGMKTIDLSTNKNLKNIGEFAFGDSKDYGWKATSAKVILPDNLEKIDTFSFSGFGGTVVLPSSLKTIGSYAFYKTIIDDIDLSKCSQLETIEKYAFASANGMKTIDLSTNKNLKNIGEAAFGNSNSYGWKATSAKVILPDNLEKIDTLAFLEFGGTVVLPSSLKTIGSYAFYKTTITDIDLSKCSQLETIEKYAFASANGMKTIDLSTNKNLKNIGEAAFGNSNSYGWKATSAKVILPDNLEKIDTLAFLEFGGTVVLPSSLKTIGSYAFYKTTITDIDLSKCSQLETIEKYAFASANGMKTIDLSTNKNLKNIGEAAFGDSNSYGWKATSSKVILPDNLEKIDTFAFSGFGGTVVLPSSLKTIGSYAFYKTTIADIVIPASVESIEESAFSHSLKLEKITSKNVNPPLLGKNVFYYVNKNTCLLDIPNTSRQNYREADQWRDFFIKETAFKINLIIAPDSISKKNGEDVVWGNISITDTIDTDYKIKLSVNRKDIINLPSEIIMPAGIKEKKFSIKVANNTIINEDFQVEVMATAYLSSCNCIVTEEKGGTSTATLLILKNNAAISIKSENPTITVGESSKLLITRNTPSDKELVIDISSDRDDLLNIQRTVSIPVGQNSIYVDVTTRPGIVVKQDQEIEIKASAKDHDFGTCQIVVSNKNQISLRIPSLELSSKEIVGKTTINATTTIENTGLSSIDKPISINYYLSEDSIWDNSDIYLNNYTVSEIILANTRIRCTSSLTLPEKSGDYYIIAVIDAERNIEELVRDNNTLATPIHLYPEYQANITSVNKSVYQQSEPVKITGRAFYSKDRPAIGQNIMIYILTNGTRREIITKTDTQGNFQHEFIPLPRESGFYQIGACHPNNKSDEVQSEFNIIGISLANNDDIIINGITGSTIEGVIEVKNKTNLTFTNLVVTPRNTSTKYSIQFDPVSNIEAGQTILLKYRLTPNIASDGSKYEDLVFDIKSNEGKLLDFTAKYFATDSKGYLELNVTSIDVSVTKGKKRIVEYTILNKGESATGELSISLPSVKWMRSISPTAIPSLSKGESATISLELSGVDDLPLNSPFKGHIAINGKNTNSIKLPFCIEFVSEETGSFLVDVVDEYTYNTESKAHVKNAKVVIRHSFSGEIIGEGTTDENGLYNFQNIPEGYYSLTVTADKHESYKNNILINPGKSNKQIVFISFQGLSYTWEVIPKEVEDEYDIELKVDFETNVPAPVIIIDMPRPLPDLVPGTTYSFILTLTNKGLITALNAKPSIDDFGDYEFIPLIDKIDIPALQAVQIPVLMKLKETTSRSIGGSSCIGYIRVPFQYICGNEYMGGISLSVVNTSSGSRSRSGCGGGGGDYNFTGDFIGSGSASAPHITMRGCSALSPCVAKFADAVMDCTPFIPPVVGCAYEMVKSGINQEAILKCAANLIIDKVPVVGQIKQAYDCAESLYNLYQCDANEGNKARSSNAINDGSIEMKAIIDFFSTYNNYFIEYYDSNIIESSYCGKFVAATINNLDNKKTFSQAEIDQLKKQFANSDISNSQIEAFISRWNSTVIAWSKGIYSPNQEYPNIVDQSKLDEYNKTFVSIKEYTISRGYSSLDEMYIARLNEAKEYLNRKQDGVCARISLSFKQKMTMTREAFEGTLSLYNGHETKAIKNIKLDLEIKDENGNIANDLFQINTNSVDVLTAIDGTGALDASSKGSANITFIPTKNAAPNTKRNYLFGGKLSYINPFTDELVTIKLFPTMLEVHPTPDIYLDYFMQRNIFGDDALTEDIEPSIPAELAVLITNNGFGTAKNVSINSAQPEIVDNEKGLAIDFEIIGANLNGKKCQLGLTNINFGDIEGKKTAVGQWWFTSSLLGHFVSYDAKVSSTNSYNNPELSLVGGINMHELIKSIRVYGDADDGINDFLVNDVSDMRDYPDALYLSNGGVESVYVAKSIELSKTDNKSPLVTKIKVAPTKEGWNYGLMNDPGKGKYTILKVTRNDETNIPLDNVWLTHCTLPRGGSPVYENKLHLVDKYSNLETVEYTITLELDPTSVVEVESILNVPKDGISGTLEYVDVKFNTEINPATFTYEDIYLSCQGGKNLSDKEIKIIPIDKFSYRVNISAKTKEFGYYRLQIQASNIEDLSGNTGTLGKQVSWTQTPIIKIENIVGLDNNDESIEELEIEFNTPVIFPKESLSITQRSNSLNTKLKNVTITNTGDNKVFLLQGLTEYNNKADNYIFNIDLTQIKDMNGLLGISTYTTQWSVKFQLADVKLYPNPVLDCINLESNRPMKRYVIYSYFGGNQYSGTFDNETYLATISTDASWRSGVYILLIYDINDNIINSIKFMKN